VAEMPHKFFALDTVGAPALLLLAMLWRWVPVRAKFESAGPHFVYRPIADLAADRNTGDRAIQEHLRQLRDAGLILPGTHGGRRGYWLCTPSSLLDERQPADDRVGKKIDSVDAGDRRSNDRRSPISCVRERSSEDDRSSGDRRSFEQGSPIVRAPVKEEPEEPEEPDAAAGRQPAGTLIQVARDLLAEISTALQAVVAGLPLRPLAPDRRTLQLLADLLDVGELATRRAYVLEHVLAFAAICRADATQAAWWGPEMFGQVQRRGSMSPWAAVEATVGRQVRRDALASAAERSEAEKRASEAAERTELAARRVISDEHVATLAVESPSAFGAQLVESLRRKGEARQAGEAADAAREAHAAAQKHQALAAPLQAERAAWLTERLADPQRLTEDEIGGLTPTELEQARSVVSRHLATAKLEENDEAARRLLQVRLLVDRRRKGVHV